MRAAAGLSRIRQASLLLGLLISASGCGSSATTATSPSTITRCAISIHGLDGPVPAAGGAATIGVAAARDCTWTASAEGTWLTIKSGGSGQGDGTIEVLASTNPDPVMRRGAIVANGQRTELSQAAASCEITLAESSGSFPQAGGSGQVQVRASSGMCTWSASADADWIHLRTGTGQGTGTVAFDVPASTGPPRSATITIAGQKYGVVQSEGCGFTIDPTAHTVQPSGGSRAVTVATTPACPWTAASNAEWMTVAPALGTGPGSVTVTIASTSGPARTGSALIAGQLFSVTQSQGCSYTVQPASGSVGAGGGTVPVNISADRACPWTATSDVPWITFESRSSGSGDATVVLLVAATSGPSRTGTATVAGQRVTVTQTAGCAFAIAPENTSVGAAGGTGKIAVTAGAGCTWAASSNASWLTVTSGSTGSGNGEVQYSVASTSGPVRSGTLTVAGRTFTVNQGQGCAYTLSPASANIDDDGGQGSFNVRTASGCAWTAASTVGWVTISSGSSGSGDGTVRFTAAANSGPSRSGAITAAGQTFTVTQGNGCSYSLSAPGQSLPAAGGTGSVNVTTGNGCAWTATSNAAWLSITSGASGSGGGTVGFSAPAQTGPARTGTLTIAGRTFTVTQAESCTFTISPDQASVGAAAGATAVSVSAPAGCAWTASTATTWLHVTSGGSGSGNGSVQLAVDANTGAARSGTATVAGQTFTVNQGSGCTYVVTPETLTVAAGGGAARVDVATVASCAWTASENEGWFSIVSAATGAGTGAIDLSIDANAGPSRSGVLTIGGRTVTITQDSGCTFTLNPTAQPMPAAGGAGSVSVSAAAGCAWTAASTVPWITITAGSPGSGGGTVQYTVEPNGTGAARAGTITIGSATLTVNQE
jgi:hypothetical protein